MDFPKKLVFIIILSFLVLLQPISCLQNITVTSTLSPNDNTTTTTTPSWISPSGEFAFGFQKLENSSLFLLAIWFDKIPEKTILWSANGDNPAPQGSKLELTATNGLVLTDPDGQQIWKTSNLLGPQVSYGAMLDNGNFILAGNNNHNSSANYLWESFKNPTDTILPSQELKPSNDVLFSRLTETNFSRGRFQLYFSNGDLKLSPVGWPATYRYGSYFSTSLPANASASGLVFNQSANIYIVNTNGAIVPISWTQLNPILPGNYYRATLDYNGVFTVYAYPKNSTTRDQSWSIVQYIPDDICSSMLNDFGSGSCGYNSYCDIVNDRPSCACPPGYSFLDPNDQFGGCKPNFPQGCGVDEGSQKPEDLYEIRELQDVNWPLGDYERLEPCTQVECESSCLQDCMCSVAIYGSSCWKKRFPLGNGRVVGENTKALIKVRKGGTFINNTSTVVLVSKTHKDYKILLGSLGSSAALNALLLIAVVMVLLKLNRKTGYGYQVRTLSETNLHMFSYKELEAATGMFKEQLGRGSFGIVYKGVLNFGSGNVVAAVKKLNGFVGEGDKEFKAELKAIGNTSHKNLVRLLGFCQEGAHRLLIYELMSNGTLAEFIFKNPKPDWNTRMRLGREIATGLVYLHQECQAPIIHCDIKPQNILLDESLTARISDFGLAKLLLSNHSRSYTYTTIRGTRGYVAPEWFMNGGAVTAKVDVYSFGVMLLEIICCRKSVKNFEEEGGILTDWAYDCFMNGRLDVLVENDEKAMEDMDRLQKWVNVAILCIQEDPSKRPTMKMVLLMLEGLVEVPLFNPMQTCSFSSITSINIL